MKFRNGFISNSSSASFVIYGFLMPENIENPFTFVMNNFFNVSKEKLKEQMLKNSYWKNEINTSDGMEEYCRDIFYDYESDDFDIIYGEGTPDDGIIIGKKIFYGDASLDMHDIEYDIEELNEIVQPLKNKIEDNNIPVKIYAGTINC